MRYISNDELDQVKMQVWNILDYASCEAGWISEESNVVMVTVKYHNDKDVFKCYIELDNGLSQQEFTQALTENLLFCSKVELIAMKKNPFGLGKIFNVEISFDRRFFFRPLYTPYLENPNVKLNNSLKYGLPLYTTIVPEGMPPQIYIDYLKYAIPDLWIVDRIVNGDKYKLVFGSLIEPDDEQMDFAAPAGFKFGRGKEVGTE